MTKIIHKYKYNILGRSQGLKNGVHGTHTVTMTQCYITQTVLFIYSKRKPLEKLKVPGCPKINISMANIF